MICAHAPDVEDMAQKIVRTQKDAVQIELKKVKFVRTSGSRSRSYARIFSVPKQLRTALNTGVAYVIEVNAEYFDRLDEKEKRKVVLHELCHIAKGTNGSLRGHRSRMFRTALKAGLNGLQ
ncbi:MAG: putative metallopeptidase [Thermoprotei archaeon]